MKTTISTMSQETGIVDGFITDLTMFTKTETLRRIREAASLCREADRDIPRNARVEIGLRTRPSYFSYRPTVAEAFGSDDDLSETTTVTDAAKLDEARHQGYVCHLYFSTQWELLNTITVWLGTHDKQPALVHAP